MTISVSWRLNILYMNFKILYNNVHPVICQQFTHMENTCMIASFH